MAVFPGDGDGIGALHVDRDGIHHDNFPHFDVARLSSSRARPTGPGCRHPSPDVAEQRAWDTGAEEIALDTAEEAGDIIAWYSRRGYRFVEEADWDLTNYRSLVLSKSLALGPVSTRPAVESDRRILAAMLVECVNWDQGRPRLSAIQVASRPKLWRYVSGWSPPRDQGVVAEDGVGTPVGAAWWRYYPSTEPGFGFVAGDVPECRSPYQDRGEGTASADDCSAN